MDTYLPNGAIANRNPPLHGRAELPAGSAGISQPPALRREQAQIDDHIEAFEALLARLDRVVRSITGEPSSCAPRAASASNAPPVEVPVMVTMQAHNERLDTRLPG